MVAVLNEEREFIIAFSTKEEALADIEKRQKFYPNRKYFIEYDFESIEEM